MSPRRESPAVYRRRRIGVGLGAAAVLAFPVFGLSAVVSALFGGDDTPPAVEATVDSTPSSLLCADPSAITALDDRAKLAQLLLVGVDEEDLASGQARLVAEAGVGGIFLLGSDGAVLDPDTVAAADLGAVVDRHGVPPLVAADVEGGDVQRIGGLELAAPSELAAEDADAVRAEARRVGEELRALGIGVDLAPVVDVTDGEVGGGEGRAFGDDPELVADLAGAFAAGLADAGVLPVLKHFPGHGRVDGDPHVEEVTGPELAALVETDLVPFVELIGGDSVLGDAPAAVMVGHQIVPGLTDGEPASQSAAAIGYLRDDLGFAGLVVSDELARMTAADRGSVPESVLAAVRAGADVALFVDTGDGTDVPEVLDRLEEALEAGELARPEIEASVARVLDTKRALAVDPPAC